MKCLYQSGYKFDQISLQLKVVVKLGDQYLSRGGRFFSAYHSRSKLQEGMRNDQQSHYSLEDEYNLRGRTQGLCGTELTTNVRPQLKTSMENLAMEVVKLFAQRQRSFRGSEEIGPDLEATAEISQKGLCGTECLQQIAQRQVYKKKYLMRTTSTVR